MAQRSSDITGIERREPGLAPADLTDLVSADDAEDKTGTIRARIEETRADMGETIDAIQERLSLSNISEQVSEQVSNAIETAKDTVYDATVGKVVHFMKNTGSNISNSPVVETVRENPLPFVLIGLGAGLLAYQGFSKRGNGGMKRTYRRPQQLASGLDYRGRPITETGEGGIGSVKDTVSEAAGTAYDSVTRAAGSAIDGVTRAASSTYSGAGNLAHEAMERAGHLGTKAQESYQHYLEEKPWAIAAIAMAAGAAIGMAIPSTRYEGELMGETRVNLLNKAQATANDFMDKAKHAANEAGRAVTDEAKTLADETLG